MSEFSQTTVSPFPNQNILFNSASGITGQQIQQNQLGIQQKQLELTDADHEQVARLSAALLNEPDLGKRGDLYSRGVGMLQSQGLAKYAPPTLPDESTLRMLAAQGVSSEKQYEYGAGRTAAQGALGALGIGSTGTGTGTGTGTTGTTPGSVATAPAGTIEPAAFNNATAVRDGLIKRGMDPDTATGAAANALHESVANPRTGRGDNGNAAGIFMWTGPRLQAYIDKTGHPPDGAPLDEQLDFLMSEWNGSESAAAAKIAAAQGPAAKAAAFSQYFLRPKDTQGEMQRRSATALQLQQQIGGGATTASTAPAGGVAARTDGTDTAGPGAGPVAPPGSTAAPDAPWDMPGAPAPDQPPAPATTATAPPAPAAPQVPLEPMLDLKPSGLTAQQEAAAKNDLNRQGLTPAAVTAITAHYQTLAANNVASNNAASQTNFERQRQAQADVRQTVQDQAAAQHQAVEEKRQEEQLQLSREAGVRAAEEAAQKAKAANRPLQGTDITAQHENILNELAPKIRDRTATEAEQRLYAGSYYAMQQAGGQALQITDPNDPGGTIAATITRRLPPQFPEPPGGALPQVLTTPGAAKAPQMSAPQSLAAGFADRMRNVLPIISDTSQAAMNRWQVLLGKAPVVGNSLVTPEFQQHLQAERDFINAVLRRESGAAISEPEFVNARQQYIPQPGDKEPVLAQKAKNRETVMANLVRDAGPAYRPPSGDAVKSPAATTPSRVIRYDHNGKRIEE